MLSINVWDLLWTITDFFLLYFLLKTLLYKPLISFMDARQAGIDLLLGEERKAQDAIMANTALLEEEKAKCHKQSREILDDARAANDKKQAELVKKAGEDAAGARRRLKEDVESQRQQEIGQFRASEMELAKLLVSRVLGPGPEKKD